MSLEDKAEFERIAAKIMAFEAVTVQIPRPLLEALSPGVRVEDIQAIRVGLKVRR